MKSLSVTSGRADFAQSLAAAKALEPQLVLIFAAPGIFKDRSFLAEARRALGPGTNIIGCSTAGEISAARVSDDSLSLMALHFDRAKVRVTSAPLGAADASRAAGEAIARNLAAPDLNSIFMLSPGLNVNGSDVTRGVAASVPAHVIITGGLAGDGTAFGATYTILNDDIYTDHAVAFGLYGDKVTVKSGSRGGWKPFGPARRITKSKGNVLYELDHKPALRLYKEYLGDKVKDLPASGLLYPFAILREEDRMATGLIRTILNVDHAAESLILAGDMPENSLVCLMHADTDALVEGAGEAATEAAIGGSAGSSAAILVSCIGRKLIMGGDVEEEIEAVIKALGADCAFAGFYSYGEICPFAGSGLPELHNQTMTITHISEAP